MSFVNTHIRTCHAAEYNLDVRWRKSIEKHSTRLYSVGNSPTNHSFYSHRIQYSVGCRNTRIETTRSSSTSTPASFSLSVAYAPSRVPEGRAEWVRKCTRLNASQ